MNILEIGRCSMSKIDPQELRRLHAEAPDIPGGMEDESYAFYITVHNAMPELLDRLEEAEKERDEARQAIERDRTTLAGLLASFDKALDCRFWLTEGRGSYAWDDDKYRDEFRQAAIEILAALKPVRQIAADLTNSPKTSAEVAISRSLHVKMETAEKSLLAFRNAMRQAIKEAGGIARPELSDEFMLLGVPAEMGALKKRLDRYEKALREVHEGATRQLAEPRNHNNDQYALTAIATRVEEALCE